VDMLALNLQEAPNPATEAMVVEETPKMTLAREKVLEEARKAISGDGDLGRIEEKKRTQTLRASEKSGKSSFSWAWELDSGEEERNSKDITVLDAPGHKDFVPNAISGASQADCALLVVDATTGEFEAGFDKGGQTREHLLLVRSLGVQQVIIAINKLDTSGYQSSKTFFVPVSGFLGVNLVDRSVPEATPLSTWYSGPTLVDLLKRALETPLRFPISNVFRGQTATSSGIAVAGRLCSGVVQVGEKLRVLPGDESAVVKRDSLPWAAAGQNVHLYLTGIDPINLA
ncbi:9651_t:CDS:2, partial [Acaulospora colombiana]